MNNPSESSNARAAQDTDGPTEREQLKLLAQQVEQLGKQQESLTSRVEELTRQIASLVGLFAAQSAVGRQALSVGDAPAWAGEQVDDQPLPMDADPTENSVFEGQISDYEPGMLFDEAAFDLTIRFDLMPGRELARQWGFENAGHLLLALLESCTRLLLQTNNLAGFTFRRDIDTATVYATNRTVLEQLLQRLRRADSAGALHLIRQLEPEARQP